MSTRISFNADRGRYRRWFSDGGGVASGGALPPPRLGWVRGAVLLVVAAGLLDLLFTLEAMTGSGMVEANPLAVRLVSLGLPTLVGFKLCMMAVNAAPLWVWHRRGVARFGAVASLGVMGALMAHWVLWFVWRAGIDPEAWRLQAGEPGWVLLEA
jgi:hypothetical protein